MALTKEDLEKIKTPLSDEDYVMLHDEEVRTSYKVWDFAPKELNIYYLLKLIECFDKRYPGNTLQPEEMCWTPPLTEEYKDYPKGEKKPILTKEDFQNIKLPLSDIDYLRLHAYEETDWREYWEMRKEFPEIWEAFDRKESDCFDLRYPGNNAVAEDIWWVMPPSITADNVDEIEDPIAKKVAIRYILKDYARGLMWKKVFDQAPVLKKFIKQATADGQSINEEEDESNEDMYQERYKALCEAGYEKLKQNDFNGAIKCFEKAGLFVDNNLDSCYGLYRAHYAQGNYVKAFNAAHLGLHCYRRNNLPKDSLYSKLSEALIRMAVLCRENQTVGELEQKRNDIESALDTFIDLHEAHDNPTGFIVPLENCDDEAEKEKYHVRFNPNEDHFVCSAVICMLAAAEDDWKRRINRRLFNIRIDETHFRQFVDDMTPKLSEHIVSTTEPEELKSFLKNLHDSLIAQYVQAINDFFLLYDYYCNCDKVKPHMYLYNLTKVEEEMSNNDVEIKRDLPESIIKIKSALINLRYLYLKRVFIHFPIDAHDTLNYGMEEAKALLSELLDCMSYGIFPGKVSGLERGAKLLGIDKYFSVEKYKIKKFQHHKS